MVEAEEVLLQAEAEIVTAEDEVKVGEEVLSTRPIRIISHQPRRLNSSHIIETTEVQP